MSALQMLSLFFVVFVQAVCVGEVNHRSEDVLCSAARKQCFLKGNELVCLWFCFEQNTPHRALRS